MDVCEIRICKVRGYFIYFYYCMYLFFFLFLFDWQFVVCIGFILSIDGVEIKGNIVIRKRIDATE